MRSPKYILCVVAGLLLSGLLSCSENPASSQEESGSIKLSIKSKDNSTPAASAKTGSVTASMVTITSSKVVIDEIEFESTEGDSFDFELEEPFVQDLAAADNRHVIANITIPFGSYKESEIEIDELGPADSEVYNSNPELQNKSILVKGFTIFNNFWQTIIIS